MSFNSKRRNDNIVVVGGGLAGLTAAVYLARGGRRVTLFEKAQDVGGRAQTRQLEDYFFNLGPHALYQGSEAEEILADLDVSVRGGKPSTDGALVMQDNALHQLPADPRSFVRNDLMSVGERMALVIALLKVLRTKPASAAHLSAEDWVNRHTTSPAARDLLLMLMRVSTYCSAGAALSAEVFLRQLQLTLHHGVLYLDGGWQKLVDALHQKVREAGVEIVRGCRAERITAGTGGPEVMLADGSVRRATAVVLAVEPHSAQDLLPEDEALAKVVARLRPVRAATLDLALRRLPRPDQPLVFGLREPLYLSVHSAVAKLAPAGGAVVHLAKYLNHTGEDAEAEQELEKLMDLAQPGWRAEVVHRRFLPHLTVVNHLVTPPAGLRGRPDSDTPDTPGVYLAGDWIGDEGWLADASFASARTAARLALQQRAMGLHSKQVHEPAPVFS
ncbi:MAG: phytoene desaturase family protein [Chloroflexota bacterium]